MRNLVVNKILYISIALFMFGTNSLFAKNAQKEALYDAEIIKVISQDLVKNYFYIQQGIQVPSARKGLKQNILELESTIKHLQDKVTNSESKRITEFMMFSMDELKATIRETFNVENGGLVLDYTEALLEGSESIVNRNKGKKESMLDVIAEMEFLLERASKYYIAFRAGYTDDINVAQAKEAVRKFETLLVKVKKESYPPALAKGPVKKISKYWPVSRSFYMGIKKSELPTIVFISTKHMKKALSKLLVHHKK